MTNDEMARTKEIGHRASGIGHPVKRTHRCGELRIEHVGQTVTVMGWVQVARDHGGIIFVDLRDRSGIVQVVANPQFSSAAHRVADQLRSEWVICASGEVRERPEETKNPDLVTGDVEIFAQEIVVLNEAKTPPFPVEDNVEVDEIIRLKYRYIDLRRPIMQRNLHLRHRFILKTREYMDRQGFWEIETPMLLASTPEGARDYIVPSRVNPGRFYALPQSPQLLKQTLMISGIERYFQIAKCLRDEDLRADRQPEHTQIDIEMSFVQQDDVLETVEGLMAHTFAEIAGYEPPRPFPRLSYPEAMARYGTDKPDLRFGMEIGDCTDVARSCGFAVFAQAAQAGGVVRGIAVPGGAHFSRRELDELAPLAKSFGAEGAAWIVMEPEGTYRSPLTKFFSQGELDGLRDRLGGNPGDVMVFCADQARVVSQVLGQMRLEMARRLSLVSPGQFRFLWITDFPLFEYDEELGHFIPMHHPFTMPHPEDLEKLDTDPGAVGGQLYDLVLNGSEMGSGSIRIHRPEIQQKVFDIIGLSREEAQTRFGFLLEAFEYGAPPHGGIGLGLDRIVAEILGLDSIRDVIAFPKTQSAVDPMTGAPSPVSPEQLAELHIAVVE